MRSFLFFLLFIGCTSLAFCARNVDQSPLVSVQSGRFFTQFAEIYQGPADTKENKTIELQVVGTSYMQSTGDLIVQFISLTDPNKLRLKDRQELHFKNPGGQLISVRLPVRSYTVVGQTLALNFPLAGATTGKLELLPTQSIVIEDIIVN